MDSILFREAVPSDSAALGALQAAVWREAYADLLPGEVLDAVTAEERSAMWRAVLEDPGANGGAALFVAERGNALVGFGACALQRDAGLRRQGFDREVGALYVLRSHSRSGAGRALMGLMARRLVAGGGRSAALWVLRGNSGARRFYETLGGSLVGERSERAAGATLEEIAYGWRDLAGLARQAP